MVRADRVRDERSSVPALGHAGAHTFCNVLLTFADFSMMALRSPPDRGRALRREWSTRIRRGIDFFDI